MIKLAIEGASLASFAVIGLLLFVSIFVGVSIWAFTRRSNQLAGWSSMPLTDGNIFNVPNTTPSAPQVSIPKAQSSQNNIQLDLVNFDQEGQKISCGKCENCTCNEENQA